MPGFMDTRHLRGDLGKPNRSQVLHWLAITIGMWKHKSPLYFNLQRVSLTPVGPGEEGPALIGSNQRGLGPHWTPCIQAALIIRQCSVETEILGIWGGSKRAITIALFVQIYPSLCTLHRSQASSWSGSMWEERMSMRHLHFPWLGSWRDRTSFDSIFFTAPERLGVVNHCKMSYNCCHLWHAVQMMTE